MLPSPSPRATLHAIMAMCAAMALFVVNDTLVKLVTATLQPGLIMTIRGAFATAFVLLFLVLRGELGALRQVRHPLVLVRAVLEGLTAACFITALTRMAIADITAILLTSPLLITAASALLLGETVRWRRWAAVIVGFAGMLLVAQPGGSGMADGLAVTLAIASAVLVAVRDLLTRRIPPAIPSLSIALTTTVGATLTGLILSLGQSLPPVGLSALAALFLAALAVALGNIAIILAFRDSEVSVVSPYRYTVIVWAVLAGVMVFGEWPGAPALLGIALIVGSGLYTLYREQQLRHRDNSPQPK